MVRPRIVEEFREHKIVSHSVVGMLRCMMGALVARMSKLATRTAKAVRRADFELLRPRPSVATGFSFDLSEPSKLVSEPQLAVLLALDASLLATTAALDARHGAPHVAGRAPDAPEDVRLAAAIVSSVRALRCLVAEYEAATNVRSFSPIPF